jgi:hypothetical protein
VRAVASRLRRTVGVLGVTGLCAMVLGGGPALAEDSAPTVEEGVLDGAPFRITIPAGWKGDLLLWAHGYSMAPQGYRGFDKDLGVLVCPLAMQRGFACAQSAFSRQGFAVEEGVLETEALRRHFVATHGEPRLTIIAGSHLGGMITFAMMEMFPDSYGGGLAAGANNEPKLVHLKERAFDSRLLFDYFFPGLPGSVVEFPHGAATFPKTQERAQELVKGKEDVLAEFCRVARFRDPARAPGIVAFYTEVLRELSERAGGNAFDNRNTVYTRFGTAKEEVALNQAIPRYRADPEAVAYFQKWYTPTGKIKAPLLAVNKLVDDISPVESTRYYEQLVQIAGAGDLFVQQHVPRVEGPSLLGEEFAAAFDELLAWIRNGTRPPAGLLKVE